MEQSEELFLMTYLCLPVSTEISYWGYGLPSAHSPDCLGQQLGHASDTAPNPTNYQSFYV